MVTTGQIIEITGLTVATLLAVIVIFWVALDIWEKFVEKNKTKPEPEPIKKPEFDKFLIEELRATNKQQQERISGMKTRIQILEERLKTYEEICR